MADDKFEALIKKQMQRENAMKEVKEDYIDDTETPKKQITVKIFPNTHKKLKLIAASKDTSIEKIATAIIEDKVADIDIVEYVRISFETGNDDFDWLLRMDADNAAYDLNDEIFFKGNPRKRINVKVSHETHKKLRVISAIQDRSLDRIVGSVIEYEIGETNDIDTVKLLDEILEVMKP